MKCKYPVNIYDKIQGKYIQVPCGKCIFCCQARSRDWQNRLKKEFNFESINFFVTLTYDEDNLPYISYEESQNNIRFNSKLKHLKSLLEPYDLQLFTKHNTNYRTNSVPSLSPSDICKFNKRLRINLSRRNGKLSKNIKIKYYQIGEYGPKTLRPHYHCIIGLDINTIGVPFEFMRNLILQKVCRLDGSPIQTIREYVSDAIERSWSKGFVKIDELNEERIQYCTKYMFKFTDKTTIDYFRAHPGLLQPFKRSSNGIGEKYVFKNKELLYNKPVLRVNNHINRLPRYMRNKILANCSEDKAQAFRERFYFDEDKQRQIELDKLHRYLLRTGRRMHDNLDDPEFINYIRECELSTENSIIIKFTKKRKL